MSKIRLASTVLLLTALTSGCRTFNQHQNDHWSAMSIPARANRTFTGYDGQRDGSFGTYIAGNLNDMGLFLRRHFLNSNPRNPFQAGATAPFVPPSNPNGDAEFEVSADYERRTGGE